MDATADTASLYWALQEQDAAPLVLPPVCPLPPDAFIGDESDLDAALAAIRAAVVVKANG